MSGSPDRRVKPSEDEPARRNETVSNDAELPPGLLDQVVTQTRAQLVAPGEVDEKLRPALAEVARRFPGQPLALDPVAVALLEAVLTVSFPVLASRSALLARAARIVAQTLLADPSARLRLEHLWQRLLEEQP